MLVGVRVSVRVGVRVRVRVKGTGCSTAPMCAACVALDVLTSLHLRPRCVVTKGLVDLRGLG